MILHKAVGVKMKWISDLVFGKIGKEGFLIPVIEEYVLPLIASRNNVIQSSLKMDTRFTSHHIRIS